MVIDKIINNNVVSSFDENQKEIVLMGRGIGFQKKIGDEIQEDQVEKVFAIANQKTNDRFKTLLEQTPIEYVRVSNEIISYAKCSLGKRLNDNIYVALTDHMSFALDRHKQGIAFQNAFMWEIKHFYNHEYLIGKEALLIIKKRLHVELPEDEAGFVALHIVNAEMDTNMENTLSMTKLIQGVINIVKYHYNVDLPEETLDYERFLTHLKFFVQRIVSGRGYETDDPIFCEMIKKQYPKAYQCTGKIRNYIKKEMDYDLSEEEMMYLTVHIRRITRQD